MMLAARGAFLAARRGPALPYDAEVEYLETKATGPFLILPRVPNHCAFDFKLRLYFETTGATEFAGCKGGGASLFQLVLGMGIVDYPTTSLYRRVTYSMIHRQWFDIEVDGSLLKIDGTTVKSDFNNNFEMSWTPSGIGLFGTCNASYGWYGRADKTKIAYFQYAANGIVVFDGVPVRFTNERGQSEGAMYDRLGTGGMNPDGSPRTDGLYRNRGTDAFLYGADKTA